MKKLLYTCARCGLQETIDRGGRFRDEDYYELWHESQATERQLRRELLLAQRQLARLTQLLEHREALAQNFELLAQMWQREAQAALAVVREAAASECPF